MFEFVVGVFILILVALAIALLVLVLIAIKELLCDIYEEDIYEERRRHNGCN